MRRARWYQRLLNNLEPFQVPMKLSIDFAEWCNLYHVLTVSAMFFAVEVFSVMLANGLSAPHDSIRVLVPPPPPLPIVTLSSYNIPLRRDFSRFYF